MIHANNILQIQRDSKRGLITVMYTKTGREGSVSEAPISPIILCLCVKEIIFCVHVLSSLGFRHKPVLFYFVSHLTVAYVRGGSKLFAQLGLEIKTLIVFRTLRWSVLLVPVVGESARPTLKVTLSTKTLQNFILWITAPYTLFILIYILFVLIHYLFRIHFLNLFSSKFTFCVLSIVSLILSPSIYINSSCILHSHLTILLISKVVRNQLKCISFKVNTHSLLILNVVHVWSSRLPRQFHLKSFRSGKVMCGPHVVQIVAHMLLGQQEWGQSVPIERVRVAIHL